MRARLALLAALLAALLYAAFAAGAARQPGEAWFEVAMAVLALAATTAALLDGALGARAAQVPRAAWWGLGLLAGFVAWSGLTLAWSISPDNTWEEFNRVLSYALVVGLGLLIGVAVPRAIERFALGWLAIVVLVAIYALGTKVAPGLHVSGLFDLDKTDVVARLRAPLEYWNALGLLCALGAPVAVRLATDLTRSRAARLAGLEIVYLLAIVIALTYSRGAVGAFLIAAVVLSAVGTGRLRGLVVLAAATLAAAAPLAVAFGRKALTANGEPLGPRIHDGRLLGLVVAGCALVLLAVGILLLHGEQRVRWSQAASRRVFRLGAAAAAVLVLAGAGVLARSQRGFEGSISHAVAGVTELRQDKLFDPVRLASTNSGNRVVWWKEGIGAWSARPLGGWGAGTFAILHLRYRHNQLAVTQAHSGPVQTLAETGLIGLVLAYGGLLTLLAAAIARTRAMPGGRTRDLTVALLAAAIAWFAHNFFDWDWNIPAVTAPVLAMLAIVAARPQPTRPPLALSLTVPSGPGRRYAMVAVAALLATAALGSIVFPLLATSRSDAAAVEAGSNTPATLQDAAAKADLAARLDPLSTRPLFVASAIALNRGRLLDARADLLEAAGRAPQDPEVWSRLAAIAVRLADWPGYLRATQRLFALDPHNPQATAGGNLALLLLASPADSATATGTPLVAGTTAPAPAGR